MEYDYSLAYIYRDPAKSPVFPSSALTLRQTSLLTGLGVIRQENAMVVEEGAWSTHIYITPEVGWFQARAEMSPTLTLSCVISAQAAFQRCAHLKILNS